MRIKYSRKFIKMLAKAPISIRQSFKERLKIFLSDSLSPQLNYHKLHGKYRECHSINISGDWRVIFEEFDNEDLIVFYFIGTHSHLYK